MKLLFVKVYSVRRVHTYCTVQYISFDAFYSHPASSHEFLRIIDAVAAPPAAPLTAHLLLILVRVRVEVNTAQSNNDIWYLITILPFFSSDNN